jgi:hypothetical protein
LRKFIGKTSLTTENLHSVWCNETEEIMLHELERKRNKKVDQE